MRPVNARFSEPPKRRDPPYSRRELLARLAGVPVVALAGCSQSAKDGFDGQLLSPDFSIAHRLRDGWRPKSFQGTAKQKRVVIVGGGIAGLSAAWQLRKMGIDDFVVLESADAPGGTAIGGERNGFQFPWGAHYVPAPMKENADLVELFNQMGAVEGFTADGEPQYAEHVLCREPEERVFADGVWSTGLYPAVGASETDREELERFRRTMQNWAMKRDASGRRSFVIPMSQSGEDADARKLDSQSMQDWMHQQGFRSPRLLWLVDYACRDDYGLTIQQASAWAGVFYFASRMKGDTLESQPVLTWPNGNHRIVQFLADSCSQQLRTRQFVTSITATENSNLVVSCVDASNESISQYHADDVIFAAPQFLAPHLITSWTESGRNVQSFRYGGWVVANVQLRDRPEASGGPMCWDNVIYDSRSLGYVTSTHQTGRDHGATVITWYSPLLDDDPRISRTELLKLSWQDWVSVVVSDLQKAHPDIHRVIHRIDVMRWGHAMIQPRVGFVWSDARQQASESLGKIHFASTDLSGIALMEEAFDRGVCAARKIIS